MPRWLRVCLGLLLCTAAPVWAGTYYYVSPAGNDANPGTLEAPWRTIAHAADVVVQPGDAVFVAPGTYPEPIRVRGAGEEGILITFVSQTWQAAVITGDVQPLSWAGDHTTASQHAHGYIAWNGFTFANTSSLFQVRAPRGWVFVSNVFRYGQNAINGRGDALWVANNRFDNLQHHWLVLFGSAGSIVEKNTVRHINVGGRHDPANSAVSKFGFTTGLILRLNDIQDSVGPGIWLDYENRHFLVEDNTVKSMHGRTANWQGPGIWTEIDPGPGIIRRNHLEGNEGAGIGFLESAHVTAESNTIICGPGYAGLELRGLDRGGPRLEGNVFRDNRVEGCAEAGVLAGHGTDPGFDVLQASGNTFIQEGTPLYLWYGRQAWTEAEACATMGFECE